MGAAAGGGAIGGVGGAGLGMLMATLLAPATGGASLAAGALLGGGLGAMTGYGMEKSAQSATNAAHASSDAASVQQNQAAALQQQILTQPKQITPDNFLASKAKELASLKLGIGSTITGGGNTSGVLASPSLAASYPGKTKLGS